MSSRDEALSGLIQVMKERGAPVQLINSLEFAGEQTSAAEVVHQGEKLILPEGMNIVEAIRLLNRRADYLEADVEVSERLDIFPWDGAYALAEVIKTQYGWAEGQTIKSFFSEQKPQIIKVATGPDTKVDVPWGRFSLPHIDGYVETGYQRNSSGRLVFNLEAVIKRKDEITIRRLFDEVREYCKENSIYRGKAIKLRFRDDDGDLIQMPEPEFIDVDKIDPNGLIYSRDLMRSIRANLFTPIQRVRDCVANGIKVKRGILLGGPYGTGKTLAATVAARLAVDNGVTYIYTPHADELGDAIEFAKQYQSPACVVFCEDIDREMDGDRSVEMDDILNILDGIDTKSGNIITVLTTNHLENINRAMLRPGRLDAIIDVVPPDEEAAVQLVKLYGNGSIADNEDLTAVGKALDGQIPAVIEEVVKRAKLFQLSMSKSGERIKTISSEAIIESAATMKTQIELLETEVEEVAETIDELFQRMFRQHVGEDGRIKRTDKNVRSIKSAVGA